MQSRNLTVNGRQCLALSHAALGDFTEAKRQISLAEAALKPGESAFSCWSYLSVASEEMAKHLEEMGDCIDQHRPAKPPFLTSDTPNVTRH